MRQNTMPVQVETVERDEGELAPSSETQDQSKIVEAFGSVAQQLSAYCLEVADIAAVVYDASEKNALLKDEFSQIADAALNAKMMTGTIREAAVEQNATATAASETLSQSMNAVDHTTSEITALVSVVGEMTNQLQGLQSALDKVGDVASAIDNIARQTNLLALNATIEAARAGESGKGFAVVANEVKQLAGQTTTATKQIEETLEFLGNEAGALIGLGETSMTRVESVQESTAELNGVMADVNSSMGQITNAVGLIQDSIEGIDQSNTGLLDKINAVQDQVEEFSEVFTGASYRIYDAVNYVDDIVGKAAMSGISNHDTLMIKTAMQTAQAMSKALDEEVANGNANISDLFDHDYQAVEGTNPQQYLSRMTNITDRLFPRFQEPALEISPHIQSVVAIDTNGYMPTHNANVTNPQGSDPVWNAANCRQRRMWDDWVGQQAAKNTEPYFLQTYRRDFGGGKFVMLKDVSAPILVNGRHWGGLRVIYEPA